MAFINRMDFIWWPTMLLCIPLMLLAVPMATAGSQTVLGVVGQQVFLNPGYFGDLSKSETLWKFEQGVKNLVPILDYVHGGSTEYPNEQFKSRLQYNASSGSLQVKNLRPEDRGNFIFHVAGQAVRTLKLIVIVAEISWKAKMIIGSSLIALMLSLFYLGACLALRWKKPNQDYKSLIVCNILSFVFTIIALSFWINIKDHVFTAVVALCTVSFWFLAMIAVFVPNLPSLIKTVFHLNEGVPRSIDTVVIPVSIAIFGEMIQQIRKAPTAMRNNSNEESSNEDQQRRGPTANRTNSEEEQQWQHNEELQDLTGIRSESFDGIN